MSYRLYLTTVPRLNNEAQFHLEQRVINKLRKQYAHENDTVPHYEILKKISAANTVELNQNPVAKQLLHQCKPYFTAETRRICPWLTSDANHPDFAGIVTKDMLKNLICDIHQSQIDMYMHNYEQTAADPDNCANRYIVETADRIVQWETGKNAIREDTHGNLLIPYIVANSLEYLIFRLYALYNATSWSVPEDSRLTPYTAVLYGW